MKNKKVIIVSVSATDINASLLVKSTINRSDMSDVEFVGISNNTNSLASIYNKYITEEYKDTIVVFVHDDVYIADGDFITKCRHAVKQFDVFGVAGGSNGITIEPNKPALWHLISNNKVGFAGHFAEDHDINHQPKMNFFTPFNCVSWVTNFGVSPAKATLIDGVLLGVNVEKVLDKKVTFDEQNPSRFHFYDLLFCVDSKRKGLSLGVFPFNIFHKSHGLKEVTNEFTQGDEYFKGCCSKLV